MVSAKMRAERCRRKPRPAVCPLVKRTFGQGIMKWSEGGPSRNVEDRRGQGGMFGGGMAPMGIGGTILLLVLGLLFGKDFTGGSNGSPQSQVSGGDVGTVQETPQEA